jgi:hypothetical protein
MGRTASDGSEGSEGKEGGNDIAFKHMPPVPLLNDVKTECNDVASVQVNPLRAPQRQTNIGNVFSF